MNFETLALAFAEGYFEKLAELQWTSEDSAQSHAKKHARKMGFESPEQYLAAAARMFSQREKLKQVRDKKHKGATVYWDSATGQKLVVTPQGQIVSFYNAGARP